jgi:hypothetical protein
LLGPLVASKIAACDITFASTVTVSHPPYCTEDGSRRKETVVRACGKPTSFAKWQQTRYGVQMLDIIKILYRSQLEMKT